jgi:hypothetical protein
MAVRDVTLFYQVDPNDHSKKKIGAEPKNLPVSPSDTIRFHLDPAALDIAPGGGLRITPANQEHFSPRVVQHEIGKQTGLDPLEMQINIADDAFASLKAAFLSTSASISHYNCELLDAAGKTVMQSDSGGEIVPDVG